MFTPGPSVNGLSPQQWAAFAALVDQPAIGAQAFQMGGIDPSSMVLSALSPEYVRLAQTAPQSSNVLPGSSMLSSASSPYALHQPLSYSIQSSVDASIVGRQLTGVNLSQPYQFQQFPQTVPVSQSVALPSASVPYGQQFSYLQHLLPSFCNGNMNHVQCSSVPAQQQPAMVVGPEPCMHIFDSLRNFGTLPQEQNRRNKPMITSKTNLYISGLSESDTDEKVKSLVKDIVHPKSCKAMMLSNGTCKGYGFIDCSTEEDAEKAKNHIIEYAKASGRRLLVKFAHENEKDEFNVYIKHLPVDFTKEKLIEMFEKFGDVTSVKLVENGNGLTGIGFVRFAVAKQAERAIFQINSEQLILGDNTAPVMCKLADKASTRRRAVASATLVLQNPLSLNNQFPRHSVPVPNASNAMQRSALPLSQTQTNALGSSFPLATHLVPHLNQPVMLHNLQIPASHTRAILPPALLPNGNSTPSMLPQFPAIASGVMHAHGPGVSNRITPLIGPPPQTSSTCSSMITAQPSVGCTYQMPTSFLSSQAGAAFAQPNFMTPLSSLLPEAIKPSFHSTNPGYRQQTSLASRIACAEPTASVNVLASDVQMLSLKNPSNPTHFTSFELPAAGNSVFWPTDNPIDRQLDEVLKPQPVAEVLMDAINVLENRSASIDLDRNVSSSGSPVSQNAPFDRLSESDISQNSGKASSANPISIPTTPHSSPSLVRKAVSESQNGMDLIDTDIECLCPKPREHVSQFSNCPLQIDGSCIGELKQTQSQHNMNRRTHAPIQTESSHHDRLSGEKQDNEANESLLPSTSNL